MCLHRLTAWYQRGRGLALAAALGMAVAGCGSDSTAQVAAPVTANVSFGGSPVDAAAGRGAIWALACLRGCSGALLKGERLTEITIRRPRVLLWSSVTDEVALATGSDGAIWIAHFNAGTVTRVEPRYLTTTATIHLALPRPIVAGRRRLYGFLPSAISVGGGRVWVSTARGWIAEIDERSARLVAMVPSPSEETSTTTESHGTWVAEDLDGFGRLAPGSDRLAIHALSQAGQPVAVSDLSTGGGMVWALGSFFDPAFRGDHWTSVVAAIDPRTAQIVRRLEIPGSPDSMVYGDGALYLGDSESGHLYRITPNYLVQKLRSARGRMTLVAATPGALWATTGFGSLLRIRIP
jgi:hypothetical protein